MKFRRIIHPGERCLHATPISIRKVGQEPVTQLGQFLDEASQYSGDPNRACPLFKQGAGSLHRGARDDKILEKISCGAD